MGNINGGFPPQQLPSSRKNQAWMKKCVDFGDSRSLKWYQPTRKSVFGMKINYDLVNMKLHMDDLRIMVNPYDIDTKAIPDAIQHYPIINSKLEVLQGEESKRVFDFKVVVTNPNAVTEIEEEKKGQVLQKLQEMVADTSQSEEQFNQEIERLGDYFSYEWQDMREARANQLLNHYIKELELPQLFNQGFRDAMIAGEEIYQCDIVGGEPVVEKLNPMKVRVLMSGYSHRIEDADIVMIEDYWSPGKVIDTYWDQMSAKDQKKLDDLPYGGSGSHVDEMDIIDERDGFIDIRDLDDNAAVMGDGMISPSSLFEDPGIDGSLLPYDVAGNIRVLKVYWKSRRKVKKVKSYDPETGEEQYELYPEDYVIDKDRGEEETVYWINEAWEGTKIGSDIYVCMGPRPIQYNRLSNPSRCHFGIIGTIYNTNGQKPCSMVDIMKPYQYLYDIIHDRLNKVLAKNKGKTLRLDLAKVPKGWTIDKWFYYLSSMGIAVEDSFKEGNAGAATGHLAGALNNASSGVIDTDMSGQIVGYCNLLDFIATKMGEAAGISKQREGQVSNRETVGGVERATLQSSYITEWLFFPHESVKKRVLECLLETAKIAMRGKGTKKFSYITSDGAEKQTEIDGDQFAECDYGLVVDNSNGAQELNQKLDTLAQAALQTQVLDFSTIMKLYTTTSLAEKQRMVEANENRKRQEIQQQQQQQQQIEQQKIQQAAQDAQALRNLQYKMHQEDNETKILVAQINSKAEADRLAIINQENQVTGDQKYQLEKDKLAQSQREFEAQLKQNAEKLNLERIKQQNDYEIKKKQIVSKGLKG